MLVQHCFVFVWNDVFNIEVTDIIFAHNRVPVSGGDSNISAGHSVQPGSVLRAVLWRVSCKPTAFSGFKPVCV
jgi:hypothetical protein